MVRGERQSEGGEKCQQTVELLELALGYEGSLNATQRHPLLPQRSHSGSPSHATKIHDRFGDKAALKNDELLLLGNS